jgi:hypothetical protein
MAGKTTRRSRNTKRWSGRVTKNSNALDLENSVFKKTDPAEIASSLKRSANKSHRRKGTPYQSAMSMLNFYINRAGKNLPEKQKDVLERSKAELRKLFGREA